MRPPPKTLTRLSLVLAPVVRYLAALSIRNKVIGIILITSLSLLSLTFAILIRRDLKTFQDDMIDYTTLTANLLSQSIGMALEFEDTYYLDHVRETLGSVPQIQATRVYTPEGRLFYHYGDVVVPKEIRQHLDVGEPFQVLDQDEEILHFVSPIFQPADAVPDGEEPLRLGTFYALVSTHLPTQKTADYLTSSFGLLFVLIVVSVFFAFLLEKVISRPILNLANAARAISQQHDYSIRVQKTSDDEIGVLSDGFNAMLRQIEKRQQELERSNRDLDQFAYVASHDLKAPLRAISTLSEWIDEDLTGDASDETREQLKLLRGRVRRMERLIDGILAYSRVGRKEADLEEVDVEQLVLEAFELLGPPPGFRIVIGSGMPRLFTRKIRLQQVFSNLLSNAIKYHDKEAGTIAVSVAPAGSYYQFTVTDDGPGIAPEYHDKVFLIFHTLQPRDDHESTGIGLAVVKKILEDQGGTITLQSSEGSGTTFHFTWPNSYPKDNQVSHKGVSAGSPMV